jgi:hypothetical protein
MTKSLQGDSAPSDSVQTTLQVDLSTPVYITRSPMYPSFRPEVRRACPRATDHPHCSDCFLR